MTSAVSGRLLLAQTTAGILRPAIDFIYPPRCPACGEGIGAQTGLCLPCWMTLKVPDGTHAASAAEVIAAATYGDVSRKLLLAFKHGGKIALAPLLARLMAAQLGQPQPQRVIVPVPLHPLRLWRRGYNQSALLGGQLARMGHGRLVVDGLRRVRATPSLDRRGRDERAALLAGAIQPHPRRLAQLRDAHVLLVDDVVTSGATSSACAAALARAGAASVTVACFAKVGGAASQTTRCSPPHTPRLPARKTNARDLAIPGVP